MKNISFWKDAPYRPRRKLKGNIHADVAIVGGGIIGISAAYHCAKKGFKTVLVEKDIIANGPAGNNMGLVVEGTTLDLIEIVPMIGPKHAKQLWSYTSAAQRQVASLIKKERINCDMKKTGSLYVSPNKRWVSWLKKEVAMRHKYGFSCKFLDKNMLRHAISSPCECALFAPQDFLIHPVKFVRGLAARAERHGAKFYEHTRALKWNEHQVKTSGSTITADKVIVAIEADAFSKPHRKKAQVIVTKPLRNPDKIGWKYGHMLWETGLNYPAVRFWDNRLMIAKEIAHDATEKQRKTHAQQMVKTLLKYFPMLTKSDVAISHSWECFVIHSPRRIFTISHKNGVYYAYGCAGNGLTHGVLAGRLLADHFTGKKLPEIYVPSSNIRLSGCSW